MNFEWLILLIPVGLILLAHVDSFILGKQIDKANKRIKEERQRRLWRVANEQRKEWKR